MRKHLEEDEWTVFAGILKGAKYPNGTTVAYVLYVLEHGTKDGTIPPRPILRYVVANFMPKWKKQFAKLLMRGMDAKKALKQLGEIMAGDIRKTMSNASNFFEGNSESTIRGKGFDAPFRDTGHMIGSVSYELRKGKKKGLS